MQKQQQRKNNGKYKEWAFSFGRMCSWLHKSGKSSRKVAWRFLIRIHSSLLSNINKKLVLNK
jgi:hypothetical protein